MNKLTETPPVTDLGPLSGREDNFPREVLQAAFDAWSEPITGNVCDVMQSSHGRAFIAGWLARGDYDA